MRSSNTFNLLKVASSLVLVAWTDAARNNLKVNKTFVILYPGPDLILSEARFQNSRSNCNLTQIGEHHGYLLQYAGCAAATLLISALYNAGTFRCHLVIVIVIVVGSSMAAWQKQTVLIFVIAG